MAGSIASAKMGPDGIWGPKCCKGKNYCEAVRLEDFARTPVNAWTNLAYALAGGWAIGRATECFECQTEHHNAAGLSSAKVALLLLVGVSNLGLGLGSFLFHASLQRWGQQLDVGAMYWAMNAALCVTCWRWWRRLASGFAPDSALWLSPGILGVLVADYFMWYYKWNLSTGKVFAGQIIAVIVSEALLSLWGFRGAVRTRHGALLASAVICCLVGYLIREAEVRQKKRGEGGLFCNPETLWQPHAAWHLLTAAALLALSEVQLGPYAFPWGTGARGGVAPLLELTGDCSPPGGEPGVG